MHLLPCLAMPVSYRHSTMDRTRRPSIEGRREATFTGLFYKKKAPRGDATVSFLPKKEIFEVESTGPGLIAMGHVEYT